MADLPLPISSVATPPSGLRLKRPWLGLLLWLAAVAVVAVLGAMFSPDAWFDALRKPGWMPPNSVFGPVWTVLYVMMAVAAWLVWRAAGPVAERSRALKLWVAQLVANALWSPLFFGAHQTGLALVDIVVLLVLLALTIAAFARVRPLAAVLMVPYLAWVGFATALNAAIWLMNR